MIHASQHQSSMSQYFQPISCAEYMSQVASAAQTDIMDLRHVKPLPAADEVTSADDAVEDTVASPKRRRHGYEIDDFVVDSSESESVHSSAGSTS